MHRLGARAARTLTLLASVPVHATDSYTFQHPKLFLEAYCQACHQGKSAAARSGRNA